MLKGENITKRFGGVTALSALDFQVDEGEIMGLIGPNGSGKTTLFGIISGFIPPDAGSIIFRGQVITGRKPYQIAQMGIGRTFQIVKPFNELTVLDNVAIGVVYGHGEKDMTKATKRANAVLEFVDLSDKRYVRASQLTLVERKRLEVGRSLSISPKLLLLDEVFAGLNATDLKQAIALVFRIRQEMGVTIFIVEHALNAIMSTCNRVIVLDYGCKLASGTPDEIVKNPEVIKAYLGEAYAEGR
jgi:branched-chain amino acid transport system ATP-binding protein